mgnify:FL=1
MKQYHQLLQDIKDTGTLKPAARAGMPGTISRFGYQFRHSLKDGFPAPTTKKLYWKGVVVELLWFLRGDTNIKFLDQFGVRKMWHQDAYNFYKKIALENENRNEIYRDNQDGTFSLFTFDEFCEIIKNKDREDLPKIEHYTLGDCGYQYGKIWRRWETIDYWMNGSRPMPVHTITDQIKTVLTGLKETPEGRRHILTAIDPAHDTRLALYWCFTEDNLVNTKNGYKKIIDVKNGDFALTKEGDYKEVYDFHESDFEGTLVGLKSTSTRDIIKCTPNHEFYTKDRGWVQALFLQEDDYIGIPINKENKIPELEISYSVNQHTQKNEKIILNDKELWWVMGYFVGDGWRVKTNNTINFSVSNLESDIIIPKLKRIFPSLYNWQGDSQSGCKTWTVSEKRMSKIFDDFGTLAKNKKIPIWVLEAPNDYIVEFLEGYKRADGCNNREKFNVGSVSENLIYGVQLLLAKLGKSSTVTYSKKNKHTKILDRDVLQCEKYYYLSENEKINQNIIIEEDFIWRRVEEIFYFNNIKTKVYNFSVKDSHTYTINNLVVHNCHALAQWNCRPLTKQERIDYIIETEKIRPDHVDSSLFGIDLSKDVDFENYPNLRIPKYHLDCQMYQRSADVFLGVPLNIASYALLTELFAKMTNMIPGDMIYTYGDVHIYEDHMDAVDLQLTREPKKLPKLNLNNGPMNIVDWQKTDLDALIENLIIHYADTFVLEDYESEPTISANLSTGLQLK